MVRGCHAFVFSVTIDIEITLFSVLSFFLHRPWLMQKKRNLAIIVYQSLGYHTRDIAFSRGNDILMTTIEYMPKGD